MKKLMIAVAMIALAITSAQAAKFKWSFTGTKASISGSKFEDATVYMLLASDVSNYLTTHEKGFESASDITGMAKSQGTLAVGSMSASTGGVEVKSNADWSFQAGDNIGWYAFVIDGDSYYQSKSITQSVAVGDTASATAKQYSSTTELLDSGNFTKFAGGGDVPEPTTGLLMLVGLAGLALRRRRA